ncbi:hypothetical protein V6Z11_A13G120600 [Gossypium hirsutum]
MNVDTHKSKGQMLDISVNGPIIPGPRQEPKSKIKNKKINKNQTKIKMPNFKAVQNPNNPKYNGPIPYSPKTKIKAETLGFFASCTTAPASVPSTSTQPSYATPAPPYDASGLRTCKQIRKHQHSKEKEKNDKKLVFSFSFFLCFRL